jgi:hypothetical protein
MDAQPDILANNINPAFANINPALLNRDYTVILDRSGSMGEIYKGNKTRWDALSESTLALSREMAKYDPDGITVYVFSSRFTRFDNTTPDKVKEMFATNRPTGSTDMAGVLSDALFGPSGYITRKQRGKAQPNGECIVIATDGDPDDRKAVAQTIIKATHKLTDPNELNITFLQVGSDPSCTAYLKELDDELERQGAKFDIVDTITIDQIGDKDLTKVLIEAVLEHKQH